MSKSKRPVGRPKTSDLVTFSIKIPRKLQAQLDKAAGNSYDSRNMVIRRVLEQYFNGELCRADLTPLDYSHSINFDAIVDNYINDAFPPAYQALSKN